MATQETHPHFALFPFMAQGHMIPMVDIARLLAKQRITVTIIITPYNHNRIKSTIDRAITSGSNINISHINLPNVEAGLPEGCENLDMTHSMDEAFKFFKATTMLESQVEKLLQGLEPYPTCLISDMCYHWTTRLSQRLGIPRLVFHGTSCFSLLCMHILGAHNEFKHIGSETEYFVVPGLPDRIEITKAQIRGMDNEVSSEWEKMREDMRIADREACGTVANTFEELEPEYVKEYSKTIGRKVWCIGPVSLCNEDAQDKAERGNKASIDEHECLKWLGSHEPKSVIYVCLGSLSSLSTAQLIELGLGLESTNRPFVWVVRNASDEFLKWLEEEKFQDRVGREKGLLIQGWAPQVLILSHPSVGVFLTHCGWNSTLEGIAAGLPMLAWPVFAEQFCNEKFIVNVIKTGVRVGVEVPAAFGDDDKVGVQVKSGDIQTAIEKLMEGGEEGEERRKRARKLGNAAKSALEEGGSSYLNLAQLVQDDVLVQKSQSRVTHLQTMQSPNHEVRVQAAKITDCTAAEPKIMSPSPKQVSG